MNRILLLLLLIIAGNACSNSASKDKKNPVQDSSSSVIVLKSATQNPYIDMDVSVMDMSYYPVDYPKLKMGHLVSSPPLARVIYSRPAKHGRTIFGGLVPYNTQWRMGANEATEIEFFKNAVIGNNKVPAGRYIIYCIPQENNWKIILNKDIYTWGEEIDSSKDMMNFVVPAEKSTKPCEYLTMFFKGEKQDNTELFIAWDDIIARLPIGF